MRLFPESQVLKDLLNNGGLVNKADDEYFSMAFGTSEGVRFINFPDKVGPALCSGILPIMVVWLLLLLAHCVIAKGYRGYGTGWFKADWRTAKYCDMHDYLYAQLKRRDS